MKLTVEKIPDVFFDNESGFMYKTVLWNWERMAYEEVVLADDFVVKEIVAQVVEIKGKEYIAEITTLNTTNRNIQILENNGFAYKDKKEEGN